MYVHAVYSIRRVTEASPEEAITEFYLSGLVNINEGNVEESTTDKEYGVHKIRNMALFKPNSRL